MAVDDCGGKWAQAAIMTVQSVLSEDAEAVFDAVTAAGKVSVRGISKSHFLLASVKSHIASDSAVTAYVRTRTCFC